MTELYHIVARAAWEEATRTGRYAPPSLAAEGFIHTSTSAQLAGTARRHYAGRTDLLLLRIDPARLGSPVVWEDVPGRGAYPHVYGSIEVEAVVRVDDFDAADPRIPS